MLPDAVHEIRLRTLFDQQRQRRSAPVGFELQRPAVQCAASFLFQDVTAGERWLRRSVSRVQEAELESSELQLELRRNGSGVSSVQRFVFRESDLPNS